MWKEQKEKNTFDWNTETQWKKIFSQTLVLISIS